uniref:Uncharacterized protein n=1 Tax=Anguilla anguilla TaxID=7936 RepID=A0A0E9QVJ6_ANGAN
MWFLLVSWRFFPVLFQHELGILGKAYVCKQALNRVIFGFVIKASIHFTQPKPIRSSAYNNKLY